MKLNKTWTARIITPLFCFYITAFSQVLCAYEAPKQKKLFVAIPVNQDVLLKKDDYFVSLKRAFRTLRIDVMFIETPGARSLRQLKKGSIVGSYPRYASLADQFDNLISVNSFYRENNLYAFSLKNSSPKNYDTLLETDPNLIGAIRGTLVLEEMYKNKSIQWYSHIDHLIGALKSNRVDFMIESTEALSRHMPLSQLQYSKEPIFAGKVTLLMHKKYIYIAEQLDEYFTNIAPL